MPPKKRSTKMTTSKDTDQPEAKRVKQSSKEDQPSQNEAHHEGPGDSKDDDWMKQPPFSIGVELDDFETKYTQSCWCGRVKFAYGGEPLQSKICHCGDCQRLHGAPFQHSAIFKKDAVRLESTAEWLGFLSAHGEVHPLAPTPTPLPHKISCRACGSPLLDEGQNMIMAFPPSFDFPRSDKGVKQVPEKFQAQCHIFYEKRVMMIKDGVTKWAGHRDESARLDDEGGVLEEAPSEKELEERKGKKKEEQGR